MQFPPRELTPLSPLEKRTVEPWRPSLRYLFALVVSFCFVDLVEDHVIEKGDILITLASVESWGVSIFATAPADTDDIGGFHISTIRAG